MKNQISSQHSQNVRPSNFSQLDSSTSEDIRRTQQFRFCQFRLNQIFIKLTKIITEYATWSDQVLINIKCSRSDLKELNIFFTAYTVNVNTVFFHLECGLFGNNQPVYHFFMLFLKNQNFILYFRSKHKYRFIFAIIFSCLSLHPLMHFVPLGLSFCAFSQKWGNFFIILEK